MKQRVLKGLATLFSSANPIKLYNFIIQHKPWPSITMFKKHVCVDHCRYFAKDHLEFRKRWAGRSGVYKITFLPFRLFTYYGSSINLGARFKYHYFNSPFQPNFLGVFLAVFGWSCFSVTVVETCPASDLKTREDWYLSTFMPLLNMLMTSYTSPVSHGSPSAITARAQRGQSTY